MSKRFKGKTCVYCGAFTASQSADHVFAREFFPRDQRANLPQVPSCNACNSAKSELEHYLTTVLPFGNRRHPWTSVDETTLVRRLAANQKLHRSLLTGTSRMFVEEGGVLLPTITIPFESDSLSNLFVFIVKGLLSYHWSVQIPSNYFVEAGMLRGKGEDYLRDFLAKNARRRVVQNVGAGTIHYEGAQAVDNPALSAWCFSIFGGAQVAGDRLAPAEVATRIWAVTSPHPISDLFDAS